MDMVWTRSYLLLFLMHFIIFSFAVCWETLLNFNSQLFIINSHTHAQCRDNYNYSTQYWLFTVYSIACTHTNWVKNSLFEITISMKWQESNWHFYGFQEGMRLFKICPLKCFGLKWFCFLWLLLTNFMDFFSRTGFFVNSIYACKYRIYKNSLD